jgi:hypothetical protein
VQHQATKAGLSAIEKLGLAPEKEEMKLLNEPVHHISEDDSNSSPSTPSRTLRHKSSTSWQVLGLNITTSAPVDSPNSKSNKSKMGRTSLNFRQSSSSYRSNSSLADKVVSAETLDTLKSSNIPVVESETETSSELSDSDFYVDQKLRLKTRDKIMDGDATPRMHSPRTDKKYF